MIGVAVLRQQASRVVAKGLEATGGKPVRGHLPKIVIGKGFDPAIRIIDLSDPVVHVPEVNGRYS